MTERVYRAMRPELRAALGDFKDAVRSLQAAVPSSSDRHPAWDRLQRALASEEDALEELLGALW